MKTLEEINKEIELHVEALHALDQFSETWVEQFKDLCYKIKALDNERTFVKHVNKQANKYFSIQNYAEFLEQKIANFEAKQIAAANTLEQILEDSLLSEENNSLYLRIKEQVIDELRRKDL